MKMNEFSLNEVVNFFIASLIPKDPWTATGPWTRGWELAALMIMIEACI